MKMTRNSVIADFRAAVYDYPEEESRNRLDRMLIWLSVNGFEAEVKVCLDYFESVVGRALQFERLRFSRSYIIGFRYFILGCGRGFRSDVEDVLVYRGQDQYPHTQITNTPRKYQRRNEQGSIENINVIRPMLRVLYIGTDTQHLGYPWYASYFADKIDW